MGRLIALNDGSHGVDPTNAMFSPCRKDERNNGLPQACCLELDHGLSLEREKRWFTDLFQALAELQQDLVLDEVSFWYTLWLIVYESQASLADIYE
ncbi:hypothetical protein MTR_0212s0010 [Medicago truncatula]|uniref:Uncharacterized protein n=1 Tax=Medicago truncatula TaxID=3880 RepID=A0A072TGT3_MEDTR|nr:hypothetical protein MTR_0212s0010 [Medicago truncatula]